MTFVAFCGCFSARTRGADSWTVVSSVFRDFSAAYIPAFAAARSLWLILMLVIVVSHCLPTRFLGIGASVVCAFAMDSEIAYLHSGGYSS